MNLFNDAMKRLASTNDSFINILAEHSFIQEELTNIKGLVYTQTDIQLYPLPLPYIYPRHVDCKFLGDSKVSYKRGKKNLYRERH